MTLKKENKKKYRLMKIYLKFRNSQSYLKKKTLFSKIQMKK